MKRILHVVSCLERGGTEAFLMNHYRVIDRTKYQFDFLVLHKKDYPYIEEIQRLGGRVFFCAPPSQKKLLASIQEMVACMRANGPFCAVHSHINIENAWVLVAAKLAGISVRVSHSHDTKGREGTGATELYRHMQSLLIKLFANRYAACGTAAGEYLYGKRLFHKKGVVIHNGIDVAQFQKVPDTKLQALKIEFGLLDENNPVLGNITRFEDKKNQMFALEVFRQVLDDYPNAILLLGGPDGGKLAQVTERISELSLNDHVRIIGERNDIPSCLKLIDIYLFPSLYEGLPIALLEAQAAGCFCVSSTNVSREADMGFNQVTFCSIENGPGEWVKVILNGAMGRGRPNADEVQAAFKEKDYDIRWSAQRLTEIYE